LSNDVLEPLLPAHGPSPFDCWEASESIVDASPVPLEVVWFELIDEVGRPGGWGGTRSWKEGVGEEEEDLVEVWEEEGQIRIPAMVEEARREGVLNGAV